MVNEICQSIPFALGDVDSLGRHVPRSARGHPYIKAIQGYALPWPLFSVSQSGFATIAQEAEARDALRRIASGHGIWLGMYLSQETVQLARAWDQGHLCRPARVPAGTRRWFEGDNLEARRSPGIRGELSLANNQALSNKIWGCQVATRRIVRLRPVEKSTGARPD